MYVTRKAKIKINFASTVNLHADTAVQKKKKKTKFLSSKNC